MYSTRAFWKKDLWIANLIIVYHKKTKHQNVMMSDTSGLYDYPFNYYFSKSRGAVRAGDAWGMLQQLVTDVYWFLYIPVSLYCLCMWMSIVFRMSIVFIMQVAIVLFLSILTLSFKIFHISKLIFINLILIYYYFSKPRGNAGAGGMHGGCCSSWWQGADACGYR